MARGVLTDEVKKVSKKLLGIEISLRELRLMPYIFDCLLNSKPAGSITLDEIGIIDTWLGNGWVRTCENEKGIWVRPNKKFYRAMSEILLVGYCSEMVI